MNNACHPETYPDPSLERIHRQWLPDQQQGLTLLAEGKAEEALIFLSRAITISASFHPVYHFLESGLNTELAILYQRHGNAEAALKHFNRALFLHHDNATALAGKAAIEAQQLEAPLPAYPMLELAAELSPPAGKAEAGTIHDLHSRALTVPYEEACLLYEEAIRRCEPAHQRYHQLAALPWLFRAEAFIALKEAALAKNDIRRGKDLDRHHPDWQRLEEAIHPLIEEAEAGQ
jgi:tetratricopeptide (TPR) repeat protein